MKHPVIASVARMIRDGDAQEAATALVAVADKEGDLVLAQVIEAMPPRDLVAILREHDSSRSSVVGELITPERMIGAEVGGLNYPAYYKAFYAGGVTLTINQRMTKIAKDGNQLVATLFNVYDKSTSERRAQQIIVAHGNLPADAVYFDLKEQSVNRGEIDIDSFIEGRPQALKTNAAGSFQLFRIGDAVSTRNIHAAIYDGLRLCKVF